MLSKSIRVKELPSLYSEKTATRKISDQAVFSNSENKSVMNDSTKFEMAYHHFKVKWSEALQSLSGHKTFMNMIIHDMRNPTS
mmetsp:Transcript_31091/g.47476  ORF Transcript_31091/g.47476 Transcript_31091/m.47476 type:complete len:83 (-) Transcript_31091:2798-3046(-)